MLFTRSSLTVGLVLSTAVAGCEPSIESNASDPSGGVYWASETTMVHFRFAGQDRLALGYIDQEGFQRLDGTLLPRPTAAGLSLSKDAGRTWTKLPPLQTDPSSCTGPTCVRALIADPWIATNGTFLNYAFMGSTIGFGSKTDTFVVSVSSDAENWTQPFVAVQRLGHQVDKDSISMSGSTSAMVFTELRTPQNNSRLGMATSESNGALGWVDQGDLVVPVATSLDWPHSPLIQLVSQTEGYIAYCAFTVGASNAFAVHVVRINRPSTSAPWSVAGEIFRRTSLELADLFPTSAGSTPPTPSLADGIPLSFAAVRGLSGDRLYLAWRQKVSETDSRVFFADCRDGTQFMCANGMWRVREPDPRRVRLQLQPSVTAHLNGTVALGWYETYYDTDSSGEAVMRMFTKGVYSEDLGDTLSAPIDLRPANIDWTPCPRANGYYGHYWASVIVPPLRFGGRPWIVSAHTDSTRSTQTAPLRNNCTTTPSGNTLVYDHHVQSVVW